MKTNKAHLDSDTNQVLTLERPSNMLLAGRSFKIIFDNQKHGKIMNGEIKKIKIPPGAKNFSVKIMQYQSELLAVETLTDEVYIVKQNLIATIATLGMIFTTIPFLVSFLSKKPEPQYLLIPLPFFLVDLYYSSLGRKYVVQIEKSKK